MKETKMKETRKRLWVGLLLLIFVATISVLPNTLFTPAKASKSDWIAVDPAYYEGTSVDEQFMVEINVSATDLAGFEYKLKWNNTLLKVVDITLDTDLWSGSFIGTNTTSSLNGLSQHFLGAASVPTEGFTGTYTICNYTFQVVYKPGQGESDGYSLLGLQDTKFSDPGGNPITHTTYDGEYTIEAEITHDVAVTSIVPSTEVKYNGGIVNLKVVITNKGEVNETFTVTVYRNNTVIQMKNVTVMAYTPPTTYMFTWNTTNLPPGNYTIKTVADAVPGETETEDNTLTDGIVEVKPLPEDIPRLEVDPSRVETTAGETYTVDVWIKNLDESWNLQGWEFKLWYNTTLLDVTDVTQGPFLSQFGDTHFAEKYGDVDWPPPPGNWTYEDSGCILAGCVLLPGGETPSGEGILANVTFTATGTGSTSLALYYPGSPYRAKFSDSHAEYIPVVTEFPNPVIISLLLFTTLTVIVFVKKVQSGKHESTEQ